MKEVFIFPTKSHDMSELQGILKELYGDDTKRIDCSMLGSYDSRNRLVQLPLKALILESAIEWGAKNVAEFVEFKNRSSEHITVVGIETMDSMKEFCKYALKLGINVSMLDYQEVIGFLTSKESLEKKMKAFDDKVGAKHLLSWEEI